MKKIILTAFFALSVLFLATPSNLSAQDDTLRIMAYNCLHFGDGCQGSLLSLNQYLRNLVSYTNSDLIGLDKVQAIKLSNSDPYGISPTWFADTVIHSALDAAYPGRYAYCTLTDYSQANDNDMSILFYNQNKLGFINDRPLYVGEEDFDLYKLFYKDPNLSTTHDSTFLYIIVCHTISGTSSTGRDGQAQTVVDSLEKIFYHTPNLIYMGDFNTHNSSEPGYSLLTQSSDTSFVFDDPPFHPDAKISYPINWTSSPSAVASELTYVTRASSSSPNSCGNGGGASNWYDHILISPWIAKNFDYISYIHDSWHPVGNDGKRVNISVNDTVTNGKNTSAPYSVLNDVLNFSDKYPVVAELGVTYNTTGNGPANPVRNSTGTSSIYPETGSIQLTNPVKNTVTMHFSGNLIGQKATMGIYDVCGRLLYSSSFNVNSTEMEQNISLSSGLCLIHLQVGQYGTTQKIVKE